MNKKAFIYGIIAIILWGSAFAAIRASLIGGYSAGHLSFIRYLIASLIFLLYAMLIRKKFRLPDKEDIWKICLLGWIGISIYQLGVTFGEVTVSAGTASMFIASAPIFTAIIASIVLKEKLNTVGWIGLGIGFIGIFIITIGTEGSTFTISKGAIFLIISAIATSIFFVYQKPFLKKYSPIELTAYFTWAGTIPFFIFSPGVVQAIQNATLEANLSALYVGIFPAAIAYAMWATALSYGNASSVTSLMYTEPVFAIIIAFIWLKEFPSILSIIGGIIAIGSVIMVSLMQRRAYKKQETSSKIQEK